MTTVITQNLSISASALQRLLELRDKRLGTRAIDEALASAGSPKFASGRDGLAALGGALGRLGLTNPRLATTRAGMLKERHLPALVAFEGKCWALCAIKDGKYCLDAGDSQCREVLREDLAEAPVIWIELPRLAETAPTSGKARTLILNALLARKRTLLEIAVATLLTSLLTIATSFFAMQVYDRVIPTFSYSTLWALVGIVVVLIVFDFLLRQIRARLLDHASREIDEEVSGIVFESLLGVRLDARPPAVGTLAAQLSGLEMPRAFFASSVLFAIAELPFIALFLLLIAFVGGEMAWVYLCIAIIAIAGALVSHLRLREISRQQMKAGFQRNGLLVESIQGAETIKSCSAEWRYGERWRELTAEIARLNLKSRAIVLTASTMATSLASFGYVAAVVLGVHLIESGTLTVGGLIACSILGGRMIAPIAGGVGLITQIQQVGQALKVTDSLLELPPEADSSRGHLLVPTELAPSLSVANARFFYSDVPIPQLDIPELAIAAGERIVLVGPPGSGKSTLLKILAGLYRPTEGRVLIGGVDMALIEPTKLRETVGYISQDSMLFRGTLRDNLTLGRAVTDDELISVVRDLGLDEMVRDHPRGLDREIAEGGSGLSGGQKQMACLARLMLRRPRIWLLDEPTGSLDAKYETQVFAALERILRPEDTVVIASHRPRTVAFAQRIIVMQRGQVVLSGNKEDVLHQIKANAERNQEKRQ